MMEERRHLPDADQLSVLAALILFVYVLSPLIKISPRIWELRLPFAVFDISIGPNLLVSLLASTVAATGTDWILRRHPRIGKKNTIQHQMIPALTAWVLGIPLSAIPVGLSWWVIFVFGGIIMILLFIAEYIIVDLSDVRYMIATVGLTAVSFALYLFLVISIRSLNFRLYALIPVLGGTIFFVGLRALYLRLGGAWSFTWSIAISMVVCQVAAGLHYLPLSPLEYGLILTCIAYAMTGLAGSLLEGNSWNTVWIEPVMVILLMGFGVIFIVH